MSVERQNCEASREPLLVNSSANTPVARKCLSSRHMMATADTYVTMEELLEAAFCYAVRAEVIQRETAGIINQSE
jgi:hypothetical protein